jgi:hypothetical protein
MNRAEVSSEFDFPRAAFAMLEEHCNRQTAAFYTLLWEKREAGRHLINRIVDRESAHCYSTRNLGPVSNTPTCNADACAGNRDGMERMGGGIKWRVDA